VTVIIWGTVKLYSDSFDFSKSIFDSLLEEVPLKEYDENKQFQITNNNKHIKQCLIVCVTFQNED
jgi:hypothetical protein